MELHLLLSDCRQVISVVCNLINGGVIAQPSFDFTSRFIFHPSFVNLSYAETKTNIASKKMMYGNCSGSCEVHGKQGSCLLFSCMYDCLWECGETFDAWKNITFANDLQCLFMYVVASIASPNLVDTKQNMQTCMKVWNVKAMS